MAKAPAVKEASQLPATTEDDDFSSYAGVGMENVGASDILIPRLTILQSLSPQLKQSKSEYIEGAKVGDICDVGTGDIFPDGIMFVPVYYSKVVIEWAPRSSGAGLVAIHTDLSIMDKATRNEKNQPYLGPNLLSETGQFFGLNLTAEGRKSYIPMASTQLKKGRRWLSLATGEKITRKDGSSFVAPLFYRAYKLTTADESNSQGDWMGWKIERGPKLTELEGMNWRSIRDDAVAFYDSLVKGEVRGDIGSMDDSGSSAGGDNEAM